jgi:hypothetical protein
MLPLLIGMGLPLFAVIGYALLSPDQAPADELEGNTDWWERKERGGRAHATSRRVEGACPSSR